MTFNDIFKSSFLEKVTSFSITDTAVALLLALVLGLFIFLIYKKTYRGVMYSASFGVSLIAMTLITTLIIMAITQNVILSLGMVGALSIVRFRTAVKEPLDIAFLFWSISAGIVLGAGLIPLAIIGSLFIGIILFLFVNRKPGDVPYILVVRCNGDASEQAALEKIKALSRKCQMKSKSVSRTGTELTVEVRIHDTAAQLVNEVGNIDGVSDAALVTYNGEYMA